MSWSEAGPVRPRTLPLGMDPLPVAVDQTLHSLSLLAARPLLLRR
ncbi:hypothetical protein [Rubrobacter taiwanensis]|jgi:hypothetical protein|nr:hypothetical protein [Rubrobacter taiwanensis]